jgi:hypothetical protein
MPTRIALRTRSCPKAYADFFRRMPWQVFCTFTFAWPTSDSHAEAIFSEFVEKLEGSMRCPISWIRGDEKRFSGCGKPGARRHFHALLAAANGLDPKLVSDTWLCLAGWKKTAPGLTSACITLYLAESNTYSSS